MTRANHIVEVWQRYLDNPLCRKRTPHNLLVQVDNCNREYKNRYFFAHVEVFTRWNLSGTVQVSFLPLLQSHRNIDQAISKASETLRSANAVSLQDLQTDLRSTYGVLATVVHLKSVIKYSGFCEQARVLEIVPTVLQYSHFPFSCMEREGSSNDRLVLSQVKINGWDSWMPFSRTSSHSNLCFVKFMPDLKQAPPTLIKKLPGNSKVTKKLESGVVRVNSQVKMRELEDIFHVVFAERTERLHWRVEASAE